MIKNKEQEEKSRKPQVVGGNGKRLLRTQSSGGVGVFSKEEEF